MQRRIHEKGAAREGRRWRREQRGGEKGRRGRGDASGEATTSLGKRRGDEGHRVVGGEDGERNERIGRIVVQNIPNRIFITASS